MRWVGRYVAPEHPASCDPGRNVTGMASTPEATLAPMLFGSASSDEDKLRAKRQLQPKPFVL